MPAGSRRRIRASIQDAVKTALSFVAGHRWWRSARAAPTAAFTRSDRSSISTPSAVRTPRAWVWARTPGLPPSIALQWAGEVSRGFTRATRRCGASTATDILNRSARSALQRARTRVDSPAARCRGHARGRSGAHRRARFLGIPLRRMPIADPDRRVDAIEVTSRGRLRIDARSPPMPICITWCAISSGHCSTCSSRRIPTAAMATSGGADRR